MKSLLAILLLATPVAADPIADIVRARLLPSLPAGTDISTVHLPSALAKLDVEPDAVEIELPRTLSIGRPSIKLSVGGKRAQFIPVTIGRVVEVAVAQRSLAVGEQVGPADVHIELRAVDGAAAVKGASLFGATVTHAIAPGAIVRTTDVTLAPPLSRGTQITVEIRRGAVKVRGTGTLELAARPGDSAVVRLAHTKTIVRGTLVSQSHVVVGDLP
jgi:flagella basal body P-ring formation protein FlgA